MIKNVPLFTFCQQFYRMQPTLNVYFLRRGAIKEGPEVRHKIGLELGPGLFRVVPLF